MVRLIIWIAIGLLVLSFFGISIRHLYESQTNQDNLSFLTQLLTDGWHYITSDLRALVDWLKNLFHLPNFHASK